MANDKIDYKAITTNDAEPRSDLRGTWHVRAPYVIERRKYQRVRWEDVHMTGVGHKNFRGLKSSAKFADVIVAKGKQYSDYAPGEVAKELLQALLDLAQGKLSPIKLANRFGYMGYNATVPYQNRCDGEPLDWLFAHANTLFVASRLVDLVNKARHSESGRKKLDEYMRNLPEGPYVIKEGYRVSVPALGGSGKNAVIAANNVLQYLLNPNIGHVGRYLFGESVELKSIFVFRAPIDVTYWYLASLIGKQTLRECKQCHRVFIEERRGVKYCLPEPGKKISKCKSLFNVRKSRAKPRSKKGRK